MRAHNERLLLSIVRQRGPMAKAEIARVTGLSAQTISVIMRQLEADGLLMRGDPVRGKVGQPSVPMHLCATGAYFFGLKVGRRSVDLILIDFLGAVLGRVHLTYPYPTPDGIVRFARDAIAQLQGRLAPEEREKIAGLGIAMPFRLWAWAQPIGAPAGAMESWKTRDLQAEIAADVSFPVYLQNDASAACGAELVLGRDETPDDFLYFYIGYFVGGGLVLNRGLFSGRAGNAGALGSMPIPMPDGLTRPLIDSASLSGLEQALQARGLPTQSLWNPPETWQVDGAALARWVEEAARGLAFASATACALLDFDAVLIDGWIPTSLRARLTEATQAELAKIDLTGVQLPTIREGTLGSDARSLGAASLPLSERYLVDMAALLKDG